MGEVGSAAAMMGDLQASQPGVTCQAARATVGAVEWLQVQPLMQPASKAARQQARKPDRQVARQAASRLTLAWES